MFYTTNFIPLKRERTTLQIWYSGFWIAFYFHVKFPHGFLFYFIGFNCLFAQLKTLWALRQTASFRGSVVLFSWINGGIYVLLKEEDQRIKRGLVCLFALLPFARVLSRMQNTEHSGRDCTNTVWCIMKNLLSHWEIKAGNCVTVYWT